MQEKFIYWLKHDSAEFQYLLYATLLVVLIMLEIIIPWRKQTINRNGRWPANFLITFLNIMLLGMLPISFLTASLYATDRGWGILNAIPEPFFVTLFLSLFLRGFISFFTHFLTHKIPFLWRIHRVHHLDTELDISTTVRFHPFEFIINLVIGIPLVFLFGLSSWALLLYDLLDLVVTLVSHANISLPKKWERFIRYVVVTPDLHRIHHSSNQPETDSNFSAVFPVWDLIFKTFRTCTQANPDELQLGLNEVRDKRTNNLFWLLISPFVSFKKRK